MPRLMDLDHRADLLVWIMAQLIAKHGYAALTMRRIADTSHLSTSSLVHHWAAGSG